MSAEISIEELFDDLSKPIKDAAELLMYEIELQKMDLRAEVPIGDKRKRVTLPEEKALSFLRALRRGKTLAEQEFDYEFRVSPDGTIFDSKLRGDVDSDYETATPGGPTKISFAEFRVRLPELVARFDGAEEHIPENWLRDEAHGKDRNLETRVADYAKRAVIDSSQKLKRAGFSQWAINQGVREIAIDKTSARFWFEGVSDTSDFNNPVGSIYWKTPLMAEPGHLSMRRFSTKWIERKE